MRICAATGHRPDKLGGYGESAFYRLVALARLYFSLDEPSEAISGMALGWDQAFAMAAWELGIPFIAAVPFEGQESKWPGVSRTMYLGLLAKASRIEIICPGDYSPAKMQTRNEWMVDRSTELTALWNGSEGGTANCLNYANKVGRKVVNLWPLLVLETRVLDLRLAVEEYSARI